MLKILHFADAHIDMANYGKHDPETGLPMRVMDFLKSLDDIVGTAIKEEVDLVLFAGDTYKDRNPAPTFQSEWEKRIMRLSRARIPTLLLVGNHDISPAFGRAHALDEFSTLEVPHVRVLDKPCFITPEDLNGLPLQVIALPWISRSGMIAQLNILGGDTGQIYQQLEEKLIELVDHWINEADPNLPLIMTSHASIQGAVYGGERTVMLGGDLVLSGSLVKNSKLDYVAMGHIHLPQNLTSDKKASLDDPPPVVYPGSIERVDFGEARDDKYFVIAEVERGYASVEWKKLENIRPFVDREISLVSSESISDQLREALPPEELLENAIVRLAVDYPREWESMIDEAAVREYASSAFEFHLVKRPQMEARVRLPEGQLAGKITPLELLDIFWKANDIERDEADILQAMATDIIRGNEEE